MTQLNTSLPMGVGSTSLVPEGVMAVEIPRMKISGGGRMKREK